MKDIKPGDVVIFDWSFVDKNIPFGAIENGIYTIKEIILCRSALCSAKSVCPGKVSFEEITKPPRCYGYGSKIAFKTAFEILGDKEIELLEYENFLI